MRLIRIRPEGRERSDEPIFVGHASRQVVVDGDEFRVLEVHFKDGARNRLHTHSTDQVLVITQGDGIVATGDERHEVTAGDIAFIPAREAHWHGARPGRDMTHLAINGPNTRTEIVGD